MNLDSDLIMGMRRSRFLLVLTCVVLGLLGLWIACAQLVVPAVIERAYRGESLPVFNSLLVGRTTHSVDEYLRDWDQLAAHSTFIITVFGLPALVLFIVATSSTFFSRFVGEATPGTLGAMRAWICGILLLFTLTEDLPSIAWLPVETRHSGGVIAWMYALPFGFDKLVTSEAGLHVFQLLTEWLLFFGIIGLGTRLVIPLGAVCFFLLLGVLQNYSFNWHQGWVPLYLITILSFTPCGDGWSVDRLWRVIRGQPVKDKDRAMPVYGWARYTCWVAIAVTYWETGLCKLRYGGLSWWDPEGLRATFYRDSLVPREYDWTWSLYLTQAHDPLVGVLGVFALVVELLWISVLFSSKARKIWPVLTAMFHMGVFIFQKILFLDLMLIQLLFFDLTGVRKAIARRLETSYSRIQILYDGHCPLCIRTVRVLGFFDLFARLECLDFRRLDLAEYNRRHQMALTIQDLDREMYVISRGQAYIGYYGYRVLAVALPAFWPLSPALFLPGVSWVGERVYGYIARNRLALVHCDSHCPIVPQGNGGPVAISYADHAPQRYRYALFIAGFCVVSALSFVYRIEYYPLTAWHLYAKLNDSGVVTYQKVFGHQPSGAIVPVRLEDAIGALRWDGRYRPKLHLCINGVREERNGVVSKNIDICKKFLTASGMAYNKNSPPDQQITHFEVQEWVWDFRAHPSDSAHGHVTDRIIVEIVPVSSTAKQESRGPS
jgi:predicted DCC family thiol-disulfide oxidoreductase YuxK